jgi:hypothetical protein
MRLSGFGVIAEFRLPPGAPEAVQEPQERFEHVAGRYAEHRGRIEDAERDVEAAKQLDAERSLEAATEGGDLGNVNEYEREARAKLDVLRRALGPLEQAVDEAGNAMLGPVAGAAESWAAGLEEEAEEAVARYRSLVEEALSALEEAERFYSAVDFLRAFRPGDARMGLAPGWHGKPMPLVTEDAWGTQENPRELLAKAAAAEPRYSRQAAARDSAEESYAAGLQGDPMERVTNEPVRP